MNNTEKYVYKVYQEKSFSEAAKKLFISQPALSSTIKKYEKQLGYEIFNRKTSPISLTNKGKIHIEYLEELCDLEKQFELRMKTVDDTTLKTLSIGGSKSVAFNTIPRLCSEFHRRYPNISLKVDAGESGPESDLFDRLDRGTLDFVISTNVKTEKYSYLTLFEEKYLIAVRKDYPGIDPLSKYALTFDEVLSGSIPPEKEIADWSLFKNVKLFRPGSNTKSWKVFSEFYKTVRPAPCRIVNYRKMDMHYNLMREGMGAVLMPQSSIIGKGDDGGNVWYFTVKLPENKREVVLIYKEETLSSSHAKAFIEIAKKLYNT